MNNKNIDIDSDLDALKDMDAITPGENFQDDIFAKLSKARNKNKNTFLRKSVLVIIIAFINIFSFISIISVNSESERELSIASVISSFSLDE